MSSLPILPTTESCLIVSARGFLPLQAREFMLPNRGRVSGMGVPLGVTLIVGGGFHGKTTLLKALEVGVYNHIPGDGRELVVTDSTAYKVPFDLVAYSAHADKTKRARIHA